MSRCALRAWVRFWTAPPSFIARASLSFWASRCFPPASCWRWPASPVWSRRGGARPARIPSLQARDTFWWVSSSSPLALLALPIFLAVTALAAAAMNHAVSLVSSGRNDHHPRCLQERLAARLALHLALSASGDPRRDHSSCRVDCAAASWRRRGCSGKDGRHGRSGRRRALRPRGFFGLCSSDRIRRLDAAPDIPGLPRQRGGANGSLAPPSSAALRSAMEPKAASSCSICWWRRLAGCSRWESRFR